MDGKLETLEQRHRSLYLPIPNSQICIIIKLKLSTKNRSIKSKKIIMYPRIAKVLVKFNQIKDNNLKKQEE